jgi:hypothetical protein
VHPLQELIEAELTARIGAEPGERSPVRAVQRNGHPPKLLSTPAGTSRLGSRPTAEGLTWRWSPYSHLVGGIDMVVPWELLDTVRAQCGILDGPPCA